MQVVLPLSSISSPSSFPFPIPLLHFSPSRGDKLCPPSLSKSLSPVATRLSGHKKGFLGPDAPVSFEVGLVSDECHWTVVSADSLVLTDDVQILGRIVEALTTDDRIDDDERVGPLQIALRLLVRLHGVQVSKHRLLISPIYFYSTRR